MSELIAHQVNRELTGLTNIKSVLERLVLKFNGTTFVNSAFSLVWVVFPDRSGIKYYYDELKQDRYYIVELIPKKIWRLTKNEY